MPARLRLSWGMKTLKQFLFLVIRYALTFVSAFSDNEPHWAVRW
jgi:hypothetical protein